MKKLIMILTILLAVGAIFIPNVGISENYQNQGETQYTHGITNYSSESEEEEKWGALDEIVIEKLAKEKGKEPKSFIEIEGDLLLFTFSLVSGIAGFIIGYFTRKLFFEKN